MCVNSRYTGIQPYYISCPLHEDELNNNININTEKSKTTERSIEMKFISLSRLCDRKERNFTASPWILIH